jgi:hypothetical protein
MDELEQLRKEVNELRERVAVLERKPPTIGPAPTFPVYPIFVPYRPTQPHPWPMIPNITCTTYAPEYAKTSQNNG